MVVFQSYPHYIYIQGINLYLIQFPSYICMSQSEASAFLQDPEGIWLKSLKMQDPVLLAEEDRSTNGY